MSASSAIYLDSSAIVKLVVREAETEALKASLRGKRTIVSSALARTEVLRAVLAHGEPARKTAEKTLARIELLRVSDRLLREAGRLQPVGLRTLDAIHLASALALEDQLSQLICYDVRMARAAEDLGIKTVTPN